MRAEDVAEERCEPRNGRTGVVLAVAGVASDEEVDIARVEGPTTVGPHTVHLELRVDLLGGDESCVEAGRVSIVTVIAEGGPRTYRTRTSG